MSRTVRRREAAAAALIALTPFGHAAGPAQCRAASGAKTSTLVELYTSEGCSSCPPADRWLATLAAARADVVPVAFHVHYWDHLGWRDRFASPAFTQRQNEQRAVNGAAVNYTPQVVVDGRDRPDWWRAPLAGRGDAGAEPLVAVTLERDGDGAVAQVEARAGAPRQLAGWWAVTEDGHESAVKAGENDGATLRHDAVVREWRSVATWNATPGQPLRLAWTPTLPADARHARRIVLVVTDASSGRPLQALALRC